MEHFTALLYIHSTNRCQLCYFKSDTCFIFLPILSTSTGICTDHTSIGSPLVSCVHTSYVPPAVFIVDNNCQLLTLCQLSTKSFYKLRWHRTVHVWLHHKNFNAHFSKSTINSLFKGVCIYKVLVYLSSPANQIVLHCVKRKLEILGV